MHEYDEPFENMTQQTMRNRWSPLKWSLVFLKLFLNRYEFGNKIW
jgi:hypothetical protein